MPFVRPFPGSKEGGGQIVTAGDLTGTVTSLTMDLSGLREILVQCDVTRPVAGVTAVQMFIEPMRGSDDYPLMDKEETATPVKTLVAEEESKAIPGAGTTRWSTLIKVESMQSGRLRFTGTAAAAGDVIDVFVDGAG